MTPAPAPVGKRARNKIHDRAAIVVAAREAYAELGYDVAGVRDVIGRTDLRPGDFLQLLSVVGVRGGDRRERPGAAPATECGSRRGVRPRGVHR